MRADVTVGAFLSGGIDSTAIAALAIRHNPRLITFTTGFEREGFSEVDVAVASAEDRCPARHQGGQPGRVRRRAAEIVWYLDEPVADPALVPLFFIAREARKHVKVVLCPARGADELFGGYPSIGNRCRCKPFDYVPGRCGARWARRRGRCRKGCAAEPAASRVADLGRPLLRQRPQLLRRSAAHRCCATSTPDWTHTDVTAPDLRAVRGWDPVARMQHLDLFTGCAATFWSRPTR